MSKVIKQSPKQNDKISRTKIPKRLEPQTEPEKPIDHSKVKYYYYFDRETEMDDYWNTLFGQPPFRISGECFCPSAKWCRCYVP